MIPALMYEPDAYSIDGYQLMGRRAAGGAFLRAAVRAAAGDSLTAYSPNHASARAFAADLATLDPGVTPRWIGAPGVDALAAIGGLYIPDPSIGRAARLRLKTRPDAYFLCGITHTLSSAGAIGLLTDLVTAPVMPWDALICTSAAAVDVVRTAVATEADYLSWRFGHRVTVPAPQIPIIPLGVDVAVFAPHPDRRQSARAALDLAPDEIAFLFAGRLSFHGKAHPYPMYKALQETAARTGKRIVIVHAGQFFSASIEQSFRSAVAAFCPSVRAVFVDGADTVAYAGAWAAADVFLSLADNVQETFGITPVEAMAAGLPVVVTDWNGYKDTVRDGIDGFRIPTFAPPAGTGLDAAAAYEANALSFDHLASQLSTSISLDMAALVDRLTELATRPDLRREMGESGRRHAARSFDWSVVFRAYQSLWADLDRIRRGARSHPPISSLLATPPTQAGAYQDFRTVFRTYPTHLVMADTKVALGPRASPDRFVALTAHVMMNNWNPPLDAVTHWMATLAEGPHTIAALSEDVGLSTDIAAEHLVRLAKLDLVVFDPR